MIFENDKKRIHESALFKRKALFEIAKGKNPKEVIINKTNSKDKKYSSKMYYKWKKEAFSKTPDMQQFGFGSDLSDIDLEYEIKAFEFKDYYLNLFNKYKLNKSKALLKESYTISSDEYLLYLKEETINSL